MFTKDEKIILVFVLACLLVGTGVSYYKKVCGIQIASSAGSKARPPSARMTADTRNDKHKRSYSKTLININTADINGLITLKGVGVKTAELIIEYKLINGPFFFKEDILNVKGIGERTFEAIKDDITVK